MSAIQVKARLLEMENNKMRLLDGCYKVKDSFCQHWEVTGDDMKMKDAFDSFDFKASMEYGDFGTHSR